MVGKVYEKDVFYLEWKSEDKIEKKNKIDKTRQKNIKINYE